MLINKNIRETVLYIENQRNKGFSVGFVPTMGALHEGHLSLIRQSKKQCDISFCSIFVNPTQFNNKSDFDKYPNTLERDIELLQSAGCDALFVPSVDEIYPADYKKPHYELGYLETVLEGKFRPGHFQGVCQVVDRLLSLFHCDKLFLGEKDFQQCMVISRLIELKKYPIKMVRVPTVREKNGLAMSSRNARLNESEREKAAEIYSTLSYLKKNLKAGSLAILKKNAADNLAAKGFKPEYVELTDDRLNILNDWDGKTTVIALVAAYLNDVRLIDNMTIH